MAITGKPNGHADGIGDFDSRSVIKEFLPDLLGVALVFALAAMLFVAPIMSVLLVLATTGLVASQTVLITISIVLAALLSCGRYGLLWLALCIYELIAMSAIRATMKHKLTIQDRWKRRLASIGLVELHSETQSLPDSEADGLPNIVYKYRDWSMKTHQAAIAGHLYMATPLSLNDPFDCRSAVRFDLMTSDQRLRFVREHIELLGADFQDEPAVALTRGRFHYKPSEIDAEFLLNEIGDREFAETCAREIFSEEQLQRFGLFCVAEEPTNTLMWSHYAAGHTGFVLGLCSKTVVEHLTASAAREGFWFYGVRQVRYTNDPAQPLESADRALTVADSIFFSKNNDWSYEKEWRFVAHYYRLPKRLIRVPLAAIKEVYLGCKMSTEAQFALLQCVRNVAPDAKLFECTRRNLSGNLQVSQMPVAKTVKD